MKKLLILLTSVFIILSLTLIGCKTTTTDNKDTNTQGAGVNKPESTKVKIACLINGTLGDKSFFDSANKGLEEIKNKFGYETKTIEMGFDKSKWTPTLEDVSEQDYDIIIVGTWEMKENLEEVSQKYPDKKYIIFDSGMDYEGGNYKNVYSIEYKQNEASFLGGSIASLVTNSKLPLANSEKKIGFLGGSDMPVINDFLVGYIEGAKYIDKDIKVAVSYIGGFNDSAKGKELALAQYNQGVDVGFNVAGQAGLGQLDAAKDSNKYAIGVDSDQASLFKEKDPKKAELIITSVLKRVDNSLVRALEMYKNGTLKFGQGEVLGLKEKAVEIVKNEYYEKTLPQDIKDKVTEIEDKLSKGEIKVDSAFGMSTEELTKLKDSVK